MTASVDPSGFPIDGLMGGADESAIFTCSNNLPKMNDRQWEGRNLCILLEESSSHIEPRSKSSHNDLT